MTSRHQTVSAFHPLRTLETYGTIIHMAERSFYSNRNEEKPPLPSRELWRLNTGAGRMIAIETIEEVFFEARAAPWEDRCEHLPIIRVICECDTQVQVGPPKRITLLVEGLGQRGGVIETREMALDDAEGFGEKFGHSIGHRFGPMVKSVRVAGWWIEPITGNEPIV